MNERQELAPQEAEISKKTQEQLLLELKTLVDNDPDAPHVVSRRMSLSLTIKQLVNFGGHFPSSVAYYALAIVCSVLLLCSDYSDKSSHKFVWLFMGSALAAQVIEAITGKS